MKYSCKIEPKNISLIINVILHILILLVIISTFYFLYVSSIAKASFKNELKHSVDNIMTSIINSDKNGQLKKILKDINLEILKQRFENDSDVTILQNKWLVKVNYGIIISLLILFLIVVFILYFSCGKVPYLNILKENIILFVLIAIVEVIFFLYVGSKYIPIKPSLISETIRESIDKNLQ